MVATVLLGRRPCTGGRCCPLMMLRPEHEMTSCRSFVNVPTPLGQGQTT